ncbi:MAG: mobile mystery protein B [Bdellovibrionota bacterium]
MGDRFSNNQIFGATPLDRDEAQGLIPSYIATQAALNAAEQENILAGRIWALNGRREWEAIVDESFVRRLHLRMFGEVWRWAGTYRLSQKTIGMDWPMIGSQVRELCLNTRYWIENKTYQGLELAARVHHRLVYIHPFPNGNGRHARLFTDCLLAALQQRSLSWGEGSRSSERILRVGPARAEYISALQAADRRDFDPLVAFISK